VSLINQATAKARRNLVPREGILVDRPYERLTREQVELIHHVSMQILTAPGLMSFNREAVDVLHSHGAAVESIAGDHQSWHVKIPEQLVLKALDNAPRTVKLGARNLDNTLIMLPIPSLSYMKSSHHIKNSFRRFVHII